MQQNAERIAQVVGNMGYGGVETVVMNYYRNIDKSKFQFDFIVFKNSIIPFRDYIEENGGRIFEVHSPKNIIGFTKDLFVIFGKYKYHIVHSHINTLSVIPLFIASVRQIPIRIAHNHSTTNKSDHLRNIVKKVLRIFSKVFATDYYACSLYAGEWLFGRKAIKDGKVTLIKNAMDLEKFKFNIYNRTKIRSELNIKDTFLVMHVGRFVKQKNHDFLLDIFFEINKIDSDSKLILIGEGPLEDEVRKKVKKLGIDNKVFFTGAITNVYEYYSAADLLIFPSLYEGLGIVGIEAQTNGLPCVLSDTIPKEVKLLDHVDFISLTKPSYEWAKIALSNRLSNIDSRSITYTLIQNSGYDIKKEAFRLQELYSKLISKYSKTGF